MPLAPNPNATAMLIRKLESIATLSDEQRQAIECDERLRHVGTQAGSRSGCGDDRRDTVCGGQHQEARTSSRISSARTSSAVLPKASASGEECATRIGVRVKDTKSETSTAHATVRPNW